jgi:hypothetical protein
MNSKKGSQLFHIQFSAVDTIDATAESRQVWRNFYCRVRVWIPSVVVVCASTAAETSITAMNTIADVEGYFASIFPISFWKTDKNHST